MAIILSGKEVTAKLNEELKNRVDALYTQYIFPVLATIRVGERDDDVSYERGILARCEKVGVKVRRYILPDTVTQQDLEGLIDELNANTLISGILLFRPLPKGFDEQALCERIAVKKDVDSAVGLSLASVFLGKKDGFVPCTPAACMEMLKYYNIDCKGKRAVVIGRSLVVGKPVAMLLLEQNATVTVCHSKTEDLAAVCREADILVAAVGRPKFVTKDFVKPGATVLDVGIHWDEAAGKLCGDVDFDSVAPVAGAITPVPGGVGTVTTSVLVGHVIDAAERNAK